MTKLRFMLATLMVALLVGCMQPGMERPEDQITNEFGVSRSEGTKAKATTRGGSTCSTNNNEVELCSTEAGSVYPDEHDGTKFEITLKFSESVTIHARSIPGIIGIRYGVIRNVTAVDASLVYLPYHRPGNHDWAASQSAITWKFWVHPAPNHEKVILVIRDRDCDHSKAICSTTRFKKNNNRYHKPLKATTRIEVFYTDPNPVEPTLPNTDPPGAVRDVSLFSDIARWQAPITHGGSLITEYQIFVDDCDGYRIRTLEHPHDFWHHVGHNGRYNSRLGMRPQSVGVKAVNSYGAGECVES